MDRQRPEPLKIEEPQKKHTVLATFLTLIVLTLGALFVWRVYYYVQLIEAGGPDLDNLTFTGITVSDRIKSLPDVPQGNFNVIGEDDPFLGNPEAVVTIVEFADFACPYCKQSSFEMRSLAAQYGDKIHYIYRDFPMTDLHPQAQKAAEAGECAKEQDMFWQYHDKMYQNQSSLSEERLVQFAKELNMNSRTFSRCLESGKYFDEVQADYQTGVSAGVRGTPTFFINGNRIPGSIPKDVMQAIIDQILLTQGA